MPLNDKEIWKPATYFKSTSVKKYAVSSHGRLASYEKNIEDKFILKQHLNGGFPMVTVHMGGKSKALFGHHAVAHVFLKKPSSKHVAIIHLDYDKANNHFSNLKWETKAGQIEFSKKSPHVLASIAHKIYTGATSKKLNEKKVIQLKTEIWNPKRKLTFKQLAAKYNIAEMNLYRIKNGESWFHVHIDAEPIFPRYKAQLKNIAFHEKIKAKEKILADKKKAERAAKLKVFAEKRKKEELAKKAKLELAAKNKKRKELERIATAKRVAERLKLREKRKAEEAKKKIKKDLIEKKAKNKKMSKKDNKSKSKQTIVAKSKKLKTKK